MLHLITGLGVGGAEGMLLKLLTRFRKEGTPDGEVICLSGPGPLAGPIAELGVRVTNIGMAPGAGAFLRYPRLKSAVRRAGADIVQTWMYHANLMGALVAGRWSRTPLIWGLRQTDLDPRRSRKPTILIARAGAWLSSRAPDRIVCVGESVRDLHVAMGYDAGRSVVIPNGFDPDRFRPDPVARRALRAELKVAQDAPLVGLVARFDPQKDHGTFLEAARIVTAGCPGACFVLCGEGIDHGNGVLMDMIGSAGLEDRVRLLGRRDDMPRVTAALDVAVSSSAFGEGFSNALGEALCCGLPVVATDVGEAQAIVGEAGRVVPPEDAGALAGAIAEMVGLDPDSRRRLGAAARERMGRDYGLDVIASCYGRLYEEVLAERRGRT